VCGGVDIDSSSWLARIVALVLAHGEWTRLDRARDCCVATCVAQMAAAGGTGYEVRIHLYDLSQGMAASLSERILGKKLDYIPHTVSGA
jgi:hypothetical protein